MLVYSGKNVSVFKVSLMIRLRKRSKSQHAKGMGITRSWLAMLGKKSLFMTFTFTRVKTLKSGSISAIFTPNIYGQSKTIFKGPDISNEALHAAKTRGVVDAQKTSK